jgi:deoxyribodipyrimidine photo-lyase
MQIEVQVERIISLKKNSFNKGTVVYWMSREQRVNDNWSLLYAQQLANKTDSKLIVIFCLVEEFLNAESRSFRFMIDGLKQVKENLNKFNIPFLLLKGDPVVEIPTFLNNFGEKYLISDFDPLKIKRKWQNGVAEQVDCNFDIVDSHNIVPCLRASDKQEFGAYTLRPRINKLLEDFLIEIPKVDYHQLNDNLLFYQYNKAEFPKFSSDLDVHWIDSGEESANRFLLEFINNKLDNYFELKNLPKSDNISNLSPFLHFGQISSQRIVLEVSKKNKNEQSVNSFFDELIIRKELSDNFCYFNENYDNFDGFPEWAKITLSKHMKDKRTHIYSLDSLEKAKTHDKLWNLCQNQMIREAKMHGYLRMYWAKKILEWSESPEIAMQNAIYLNDKYELDGRDPNGYTGIAWSIGGVHDRPWGEREIFGKVRYMSYASQIKKVDFNEKTGYFNK